MKIRQWLVGVAVEALEVHDRNEVARRRDYFDQRFEHFRKCEREGVSRGDAHYEWNKKARRFADRLDMIELSED